MKVGTTLSLSCMIQKTLRVINQVFIKDNTLSVAQYVKSADADLVVTGFERVALG